MYYSLWYYSTNCSRIRLRMQERRSQGKARRPAESLFGTVLRALREGQGLTQEDLAFKSGYHPTYISQLERGRKSPSLRTIMSLAETLNTPGSELLRRVEALLSQVR
jgi:DNA-binding XRE family transcriptional regulator